MLRIYLVLNIITPCFIKAVYICHITLLPDNYTMIDASMKFNISVKTNLKVKHINMNIFYGVRYNRKVRKAWCYNMLV